MGQETFDLVIAGASHAGLALALAVDRLTHSGLSIAIVERQALADTATAARDPRAFAIAAGSCNLLQALGVWPDLAGWAQPIQKIEISDTSLEQSRRPTLLTYDNRLADGRPGTVMIEAWRLMSALIARVRATPSIVLLAGSGVSGYQGGRALAEISLTGGRKLRSRLVAAADGAASPLRTMAGIKCTTWGSGQTGIVATIAHARPHEGIAVQHFLPAGPFAILPLTGDRCCITWSEESARAEACMALDDDAFLAEIDRRLGYRLGAIRLEGGRGAWPLRFHMARTLFAGRLVLVGDAARAVHPIAGQGVNLAFRDVAALAEVVADGVGVGLEAGDGTLLDRYGQWRRFDSASSAATFGLLNTLFSNDIGPLRQLRTLGLRMVDGLPGLKELLVTEAAGLTGEVPRLLRRPVA
jgi:2-octaprenyl-6-methoxyphenol hydroxylase